MGDSGTDAAEPLIAVRYRIRACSDVYNFPPSLMTSRVTDVPSGRTCGRWPQRKKVAGSTPNARARLVQGIGPSDRIRCTRAAVSAVWSTTWTVGMFAFLRRGARNCLDANTPMTYCQRSSRPGCETGVGSAGPVGVLSRLNPQVPALQFTSLLRRSHDKLLEQWQDRQDVHNSHRQCVHHEYSFVEKYLSLLDVKLNFVAEFRWFATQTPDDATRTIILYFKHPVAVVR